MNANSAVFISEISPAVQCCSKICSKISRDMSAYLCDDFFLNKILDTSGVINSNFSLREIFYKFAIYICHYIEYKKNIFVLDNCL